MVNNPDNIKIVFFGSGNVAHHLAKALDQVAHVAQIFSPDLNHASELASQLRDAQPINSLSHIITDARFYIISVKDDAVKSIAQNAPEVNPDAIWAHTSGSVPADVFEGHRQNYGVFYPLQTFNRHTPVDFASVPMLIEGNNPDSAQNLTRLASMISNRVKQADSNDRKQFHLAAVFACNFANRMWAIADDILKQKGFDITILEPLLRMTLNNALAAPPAQIQTGPARRHDTHIIENHLSQLPQDYAEIYRLISDNIIKAYPE